MDVSYSHTTIMSKAPTLVAQLNAIPSDKLFSTILDIIISLPPQNRQAKAKSAINSFISHPIIKELLEDGDATAPPPSLPSYNLELQKIQDTLSSLTKAVESLKKATPASNNHPAPKPNRQKAAGKPSPPSSHTFLAIARSRPLNPSLVVDLAKFGNDKGNWVTPAVLCRSLNKRLSQITPPQVQLATIRWTAKGNLIITGGPASSPQSLQAAVLHISTFIPSLLPHLPNLPIPQPRANVKWSKILINGVPTGTSKDRAPYSLNECHAALAAINPSYSTLTIMQKPS